MHPAVPTRLGEVVRFFSEVPPWKPEGVVMRVCLRAADLDDVPEGGHMLLRIRAEELPLLNVIRPYFAQRRPRAVFWVDAETFEPLRSRAPDLFSFIFRLVEVPPRRWPAFAEQGVRAALDAGVPFAWDGDRDELEALLTAVGWSDEILELRASMSFREMLRALDRSGLPVVLGLARDEDPWRVRMALARAGREGAWVALRPTKVPAGMWRLHARQAALDEATARLRDVGWAQAAAMAAWVDLEPERLEEAASRVGPPLDPTQWPAVRVAVGDGPVHVLRARIGDADVVAVRGEIRAGPAHVVAEAVAIWSEGLEPWRDGAEGPIEARLVRALRCLGDAGPCPGSVDAAARVGMDDVAAELGRLGFERGTDDRVDLVLERLMHHGEVEAALDVAEQWRSRAKDGGDERSLVLASTWLGDLYVALGRGENARCIYEESVTLARSLVEREPARGELLRDLSVALERLADSCLRMGDMDRALRCHEEGLFIVRSLVTREPDRPILQRDLSVSLLKMGDLHVARGDGEQARRDYEEALVLRRVLLDGGARGSDALRDLSVALNKLGDLHVALGSVEQALACYEESLAIRQRIADGEPASSRAARDLSVSHERLGDLCLAAGDTARATQHYEVDMVIARRLARGEPERADLRRDLSVSCIKLGDVYLALGEVESARRCYEESLAIRRRLVEQEPWRFDLRRDLSISYDRLGDVQRAFGDADGARQHYDQSLAIRRELVQREPGRADWQQDLAVGLARMALMFPGDAARGEEAIGLLRELHARGALDARYVPLLEGLANDAEPQEP
jgi:tetratricopeptide (TPR) repeat protein